MIETFVTAMEKVSHNHAEAAAVPAAAAATAGDIGQAMIAYLGSSGGGGDGSGSSSDDNKQAWSEERG